MSSVILQIVVREDLAENAYCLIYADRELVPADPQIALFQARRALSAGEVVAYCPGAKLKSEDLIQIVRFSTTRRFVIQKGFVYPIWFRPKEDEET